MLSQKTKELLLESYKKMYKKMVGTDKYRMGKLIAELEASMDKGVK
jgi:hypothetical protein